MSPHCDLDLEDRQNFVSAWHYGSWCCITIPTSVTKCSVVQKIPSRHSLTFWTFAVNLTLNAVTKFFHRILQFMMLYYQTKFTCKETSSLEDIAEIVIFWLYKPTLWPWHWRQWTNFSAWHSAYDKTPSYQVWFKMVERLRRPCPDKIGHTDRQTDSQTVS